MPFWNLPERLSNLNNTWLGQIDLDRFEQWSNLLCSTWEISSDTLNSALAWMKPVISAEYPKPVRISARTMLAYLSSEGVAVDYAQIKEEYALIDNEHRAIKPIERAIHFINAAWNSLPLADQDKLRTTIHRNFNGYNMGAELLLQQHGEYFRNCSVNTASFSNLFNNASSYIPDAEQIASTAANTIRRIGNSTISAFHDATVSGTENSNTDNSLSHTTWYLLAAAVLLLVGIAVGSCCYMARNRKNPRLDENGMPIGFAKPIPPRKLHFINENRAPQKPLRQFGQETRLLQSQP